MEEELLEGVYRGTANGEPIIVRRVSEGDELLVRVGIVETPDGSYSKRTLRVTTGGFGNLAGGSGGSLKDIFRAVRNAGTSVGGEGW
ncbi:hypothetical protein CMI37_33120 [Candidatus Pacearchaeota archaeon]|nr:hypothetical protein [Candidatus Pacearchaeota archaeon]|tara:strand:- start:2354 stop:2614 length:261 start_codon:yes stop_codon:yes gene_type:complete